MQRGLHGSPAILRRLAAQQGGSMLIETALALLAALPLCFFGFEACMMTYTQGVLVDAANVAVRYAIVHGTDSTSCSGPSSGCGDATGANVAAVVTQDAAMSAHDISAMQVQVSYPDGASTPGSHVLVTVSYVYVPYLHYAGLAKTLTATSEGVIVY